MYRAPLRELRFVLDELLQSPGLSQYPGFTDYSADVAESILGEAGPVSPKPFSNRSTGPVTSRVRVGPPRGS